MDSLFKVDQKLTHSNFKRAIFVNALTGSTDAWEAVVAPRLREQGFGTLSWNFRGQTGSPFAPATALTDQLIVGDLLRLLRETAPRIAWVNDALPAIVAYGGVGLFMDALLPLLVNPEYPAKVRGERLKGGHAPLDPAHGHMNLMRNSVATDWKLPWSALQLPTLVVTGLCDRVFLDREVVDRLYAQLPDARREDWADAGHLLPQERPEKLAESLARFGHEVAP
jgi:pimeloyl-ACP methyl ester carboxylesterase